MDEGLILVILVMIICLSVLALFCLIPVSMAKKRGRSQFGWFVFSMLFSPILGMIFLAFLGETEEKRKERLTEEINLRLRLENHYTNQGQNERKSKYSGMTVNDLYK